VFNNENQFLAHEKIVPKSTLMKKMVFGMVFMLFGRAFGQMPYLFADDTEQFCSASYTFSNQSNSTHLVRIFDRYVESIVYYNDSTIVADLIRLDLIKSRHRFILGNVLAKQQIQKFDSLTFIKDLFPEESFNDEFYFLTELELSEPHQDLLELFNHPINDFIFYGNKYHAILHYKPLLQPGLVAYMASPWYIDSKSGASLISPSCASEPNLNCLCAALQFGAPSQEQIAKRTASYLIDRFYYGYGDTSQYRPTGLLLGSQNRAVCAGYSQMYEYLMGQAEIAAKYVSGSVRLELNDMFYSGHSHAWNELEINGQRLCTDLTWALDDDSNWLFNTEENFFLTHYREPTGDTLWDQKQQRTMYEFMHQPMVRTPTKSAYKELAFLYNGQPVQFSKDKFDVIFTKPIQINSISFHALNYPFVTFEAQKSEASKFNVSSGKNIPYLQKSNRVSFDLVDLFTSISLYVEGIGTLDYCVFNGTQNEFYEFLIDHIDDHSPYSVAMAFLACAKLNDPKQFNKLKAYLNNPKLSFKAFQQQAKSMSVNDFKFALFNATDHYGTFRGFSFEYSKDKRAPKIFLSTTEDRQKYSFTGFDTDSWHLGK